MEEATEDVFSLQPPDANRVAARALVLAAVSCRALIEKNAHEPEAEVLRARVVRWLESVDVMDEIEPTELALLSTPMGELDHQTKLNATWQSEGLVVLAWALHRCELPPIQVECDPFDVASTIGFLADRRNTALYRPNLRDLSEIDGLADIHLALLWRLRQFSLDARTMDFVSYVSECTWAELRLDGLEILDNDLAIDGIRIDKVEHTAFRRTLSITQERYRALDWLLGFERLYSNVTTDT